MNKNIFRFLLSAVLMMCCTAVWADGNWTILEQPTCSKYGTMQNPENTDELRLVPKLAHHFVNGECSVCHHPVPTMYNGTPAESLVTITESNYATYGLTEKNKGCVMGWKVITTAEEFMRYINNDGKDFSWIKINAFLAEDIILDNTVNLPNKNLDTGYILDGTGHTISDMYRSGDSYVGLYDDNRGTIRNIGLISPKIKVNGVFGGCICSWNRGVVENCFVIDGYIEGTDSELYGITCQSSDGQIINCYAITNVGNVGPTSPGTITNSYGATTGSNDFYSNTLSRLNANKVNGMTWYIDAQHSNIPYPVMMPPIWYYPSSVTCEESGLKAHWYCAGCGKYFLDANHTQETTLEALYLPALGHNLSLVNDLAHCDRCNHDFSNFVSIDNGKPAWLIKENDEYHLKTDDGFTLQDGVNYLAPVDFIVDGTFTYSRNVSAVKAGAWQCWYEPFELELTEYVLEKMDVAEVAGVLLDNEGKTVVAFRKIETGWMKANTPYVFRPKDAILTTRNLELKMTSPELRKSEETTFYNMSTYDKFTFGGNYKARHDDSWYTLNTSGQFQRMKEGVYLKGQRFWMTIEAREDIPYEHGEVANAKEFINLTILGDDEPTGIENPQPSTLNPQPSLYNLNGQKVTSIQKGQVYIMNGKKFFAR